MPKPPDKAKEIASDNAIYAQLDQIDGDRTTLSKMVMLSVLSHMATVEMNNWTFAEAQPVPTAKQALITLGYGDHAHKRQGLSIVTEQTRKALILMEKLSLKAKLCWIAQHSADIQNAADW